MAGHHGQGDGTDVWGSTEPAISSKGEGDAAQIVGGPVRRCRDFSPQLRPFSSGPLFCSPSLVDWERLRWARWGHGTDGAPLHLFVDDYRFRVVWRQPMHGAIRALAAGIVTAPDFSAYVGDPVQWLMHQVWRSETVARFWQSMGVVVVPVLMWTDHVPETSITAGSVVAVRGPRPDALDGWYAGARVLADRVRPGLVLQFGRQLGADAWRCDVLPVKLVGGERGRSRSQ